MAFVWLLVPVLATVHSEGHSHRFCAEHHAFEEAPQANSNSSSIANAVEVPVSSRAIVEAAPAELAVSSAHLRCPIAHSAQRDLAPSLPAGISIPLTAERLVTAPASFSSHAPVAVLALAPKLSPPQA